MSEEEHDYQLAILYIFWRALPPPPPAKDVELRAIWERMAEDAVRRPAKELLNAQVKKRKKPFPKDPADILAACAAGAWENFIELLNKLEPLPHDAPHKNLLGDIEKHRKIFLKANS